VHSDESVNHHLELSVEHTAQSELDLVRLKGKTQVTVAYTCIIIQVKGKQRKDNNTYIASRTSQASAVYRL